MEKKAFTLRLIREGEVTVIPCDGVTLFLPDAENGRGGGCVGIRPGHRPALMALANGPLCAKKDGAEIFRCDLTGGLAAVTSEGVTVLP